MQSKAEPDGSGAAIDIAAGGVLAIAAGICLLWLIPEHTQPGTSDDDIAPGSFPTLAALIVLVLALAMMAHRLVRRPALAAELPGLHIAAEIGIWAAIASAVVVALPLAGFLPTAMALILTGGLAARYRTWWAVGLLAFVFPFVVDAGAWHLFTVDLP